VDESGERGLRERLQREKLVPIDGARGRSLADDIGAVKYMECNLITQKGLKDVFDEVREYLGPWNL
jgi:hypothetical protein